MIQQKGKKVFKEDFDTLIRLAKERYNTEPALADRYAQIAKKILLTKRLRLGKNEKILICKKCNKLLIPGKSASVRLEKSAVRYKCLNCGKVKVLSYDKGI